MKFKDRIDAGRQLAERLKAFADRDDVLVLGIPRGGVPVAFQIAQALHAPLDVFLSRKLGTPGNEELAFGAVAAGDGRYLDWQVIQAMGISEADITAITARTRRLLDERARTYRGDKPNLNITHKVVILVDDGIATGASIFAAVNALRDMKPRSLIVAAPVAPPQSCRLISPEVDELVVLQTTPNFYAVGQFYDNFLPTSDDEVIALLKRSAQPVQNVVKEIRIPFAGYFLEGALSIPQDATNIVVFVHGSGSSRSSPRNQQVARFLNRNGMATLLFDLLTSQEEIEDRRTAVLRFNIDLLTDRLVHVINWLQQQPATEHLQVALFGASTGAAAALKAAAHLRHTVTAVVSRGGRPDLAGAALPKVFAPTLMIVGGRDETVLALNRQALARMSCVKELAIVPDATHLFEEPGALDQVQQLAANWIHRYCQQEGKQTHARVVA